MQLDRRLQTMLALWALVLAATDVAAQIQPNTWLFRDGRFYVNVNENLLENGSLEDPFAASWYNGDLDWNYDLSADFSNVALGARGEHYHFRPWILPILSTPLYFALGLLGVLLFNLLTYCVIAAGTYRFARAYAPADVSALAAVVMTFASGFRHHAYNYSVDLLLVAFFSAALAMLVEKKGALAGVLVAAAVMIKPTTLLYAPGLALVLWERKDLVTLKRSIAGGSGMLAFYGCVNTYMYGRPWWTGYNRAVITVRGEPGVFDDNTNFQTPFWEGATDLFSGADGVLWWHGVFVLAIPGVVMLLRRWPRSGIAVLGSFAGAFYVFSKFQHHTDRFLFPAIALLVVPIALALLGLARSLRGVVRVPRAPAAAFVLALTAVATTLLTVPAPLAPRVLDAGAVEGALLVAEGSLDPRDATSDVRVSTDGEGSSVSAAHDGTWRPRAAPLALAVLAPFGLAGRAGVLFASMLAAALAIAFASRILASGHGAPAAGAIATAAILLGPGRELAVGDPTGSLAALAVTLALALASRPGARATHFVIAGGAAIAAGAITSQPLTALVVLAAVLILAWRTGSAAMERTLFGAAIVAVVHGVLAGLLFGTPFGTPEGAVVVAADGATAMVHSPTALDAMDALVGDGPSSSRGVVLLVFLLLPGLAAVRGLPAKIALATLVALLAVPGVALVHERASLLTILALALPAGALVARVGDRATRWAASFGRWRALGAVVGTALVLCLALGLARRAAANERTFWIGTPSSVRAAEVHLGDVPCDFLAWENMAWECSFYDGGAMGRVGLALPDGPTLDGRVVRNMLLVPTGERSHEPRRVTWHDVPSDARLYFVAAVPDGFASDVELVVRVDEREVGRFRVGHDPRGLGEHVIETPDLPDSVDLEIEMRPAGTSRRAALIVAGGFVPARGEEP